MNTLREGIYPAPAAEIIEIPTEGCLCASPVPGGNESLTYEEW